MCQSAIEWAGIACVYYGTSIPYLQKLNWWQINIRASEVSAKTAFRNSRIVGGILETECNALFDNAPRGIFHKGI
jgi:tRNA(Arg) A34 adenosine deaminase TadA